ncbi:hypothetical protein JXD38_09800 [candidate division WOR-3 bacterium]|nr:hypothetical protein [candidate division WOR-3 bacterium]
MVRCPHCGESIADGQEHCYACGQHVRRRRAYQHEHRVNPLVFVGAGLIVVLVLGGLLMLRNKAAKKQAALTAAEEMQRVQDSTRRASHQWQTMVQFARNDAEARSLVADLDAIDSRFQSVRMRVASHPSPPQESIIRQQEAGLARLHEAIIILASADEDKKPEQRDSIEAGKQRLEALTRELGTTQ